MKTKYAIIAFILSVIIASPVLGAVEIQGGGSAGAQGPQGAQGPAGAAGPNQVTTSTDTNITGPLKGNGSKVGAAAYGDIVGLWVQGCVGYLHSGGTCSSIVGGTNGQVQYNCDGAFCGASLSVDGEGNVSGIYIPRSITDMSTVPELGELVFIGGEVARGDGSTSALGLGINQGANVTKPVFLSAESQTWTAGVQADTGQQIYVAVASDGTNRVLQYDASELTITFRSAAAANSWVGITRVLSGGSYRVVAISSDGTNRSMYSINNGASWTLSTTSPDVTSTWSGICGDGFGGLYAVASAGTNRFAKSTDGGVNWTSHDISGSFDGAWSGCDLVNSTILVTDSSSYTPQQMVIYSADSGATWARANMLRDTTGYGSEASGINAMACGYQGTCVASSGQVFPYDNPAMLLSKDGVNWYLSSYAPSFTPAYALSGSGINGDIVLYGGESTYTIAAYSSNGEVWTEVHRTTNPAIKIGAVAGNLYLPSFGTTAEYLPPQKAIKPFSSTSAKASTMKITVNGDTGSCECVMPNASSYYKKVLCYCNALNGASDYDFFFPVPFVNAPYESGDLTAVATPTTAKITFSPASSPRTGWYVVEGF